MTENISDDILTPQGKFAAGAGAARWRPRLAETLEKIAEAAAQFDDEWWVIGSAAAALVGAEILEARDVDLLLSARDARALVKRWADAAATPPAPSDRFRSAVFARFDCAPLPIEAFGGFEMKLRGDWREVRPLTRVAHGKIFTPSIAEQIALLEAMGREKDRPRVEALRALF
ncbi:MAG TPA: hypothetical protein PKM48_04205 [Parvularculaceae bacterium]|nr:hypothetical protein [Parvularculaceae bacterium]HNS85463.1 hypothetical protein [Parvularculaceae bacterium]